MNSAAGSPGARWIATKTSVTAPSTVGPASSRRLTMYRRTSRPSQLARAGPTTRRARPYQAGHLAGHQTLRDPDGSLMLAAPGCLVKSLRRLKCALRDTDDAVCYPMLRSRPSPLGALSGSARLDAVVNVPGTSYPWRR